MEESLKIKCLTKKARNSIKEIKNVCIQNNTHSARIHTYQNIHITKFEGLLPGGRGDGTANDIK